jgi:N-acetylmuramic acid 6-phosphate etherase
MNSSLERLTTEARNPRSAELDRMSAREIVDLINAEDAQIAAAVALEATEIAASIEVIAERLRSGGRLVYLGAGTSGRLGVLDASECPPTFNTDPAMVVGIIAGGYDALHRAAEGAEDRHGLAKDDLQTHHLSAKDVLVGIATSGRTPYVVEGLQYARSIGAYAIGLACNTGNELARVADRVICPVVGPEVVTGSTRMKAGTATKMVLNMLTTGAMVLLGKTYGNLMVDLRATNVKLLDRTARIVMELTGLDRTQAEQLLTACSGELKTAVVVHHRELSPDDARQLLTQHGGQLHATLQR